MEISVLTYLGETYFIDKEKIAYVKYSENKNEGMIDIKLEIYFSGVEKPLSFGVVNNRQSVEDINDILAILELKK